MLFFNKIILEISESGKFAGPLPRACQIMHFVLLTLQILEKSAMQTSSNSIFEHKTRARAAFFGTCARTIVYCLRSAHATAVVRGAWGRAVHRNFHLCGRFCSTCFFGTLFNTPNRDLEQKTQSKWNPQEGFCRNCFQTKSQNRKVRFDCTRTHDVHVSPRRGTPKVAQHYKSHTESRNHCF